MPTLEMVYFCGTCGSEVSFQIFQNAPSYIKTEANFAVEITCQKCSDRIVDLQNKALVSEKDVEQWKFLVHGKNAQIEELKGKWNTLGQERG